MESSEEGTEVSQRLVSTATASTVRELERKLLQGLATRSHGIARRLAPPVYYGSRHTCIHTQATVHTTPLPKRFSARGNGGDGIAARRLRGIARAAGHYQQR